MTAINGTVEIEPQNAHVCSGLRGCTENRKIHVANERTFRFVSKILVYVSRIHRLFVECYKQTNNHVLLLGRYVCATIISAGCL
jgi:hypothetical protein